MSYLQSGTGVLCEDTQGNAVSETIYDDTDYQQVANISPDALHRNVDLVVFDADKQGTSFDLLHSLKEPRYSS